VTTVDDVRSAAFKYEQRRMMLPVADVNAVADGKKMRDVVTVDVKVTALRDRVPAKLVKYIKDDGVAVGEACVKRLLASDSTADAFVFPM
jgi:hypothetical protein